MEDSYSNTLLEVEGGHPDIAAALNDAYSPEFNRLYKAWLKSIPDHPKPFDFQLGVITDLLNFNVQSLLGKDCYQACDSRVHDVSRHTCDAHGSSYSCQKVSNVESDLRRRRLSLQRAVEVYLKEGPISVEDIDIPGGSEGCEIDTKDFMSADYPHPTWQQILNGEATLIFDLPIDLPGVVQAKERLTIKFFDGQWFPTVNGQFHLYDGYSLPASMSNTNQKLNVKGLVMTYSGPTSGVMRVHQEDFNASAINLHQYTWLPGHPVARVDFTNLFNLQDRNLRTFARHPCEYSWSNVHRLSPGSEGTCLRFTAASEGDIFVILASIPNDPTTWYHLQISPKGVGIYKGLHLQETVANKDAWALGSETLYQSYFVCVLVKQGSTSISYGKAEENEDVNHHVWLAYEDHKDPISVQFYTFGSGEHQVNIMDINTLEQSFADFTCKGELAGDSQDSTGCRKQCHRECDPALSCDLPDDPTTCDQCLHYFVRDKVSDIKTCVEECPEATVAVDTECVCRFLTPRAEYRDTCLQPELCPDEQLQCATECPAKRTAGNTHGMHSVPCVCNRQTELNATCYETCPSNYYEDQSTNLPTICKGKVLAGTKPHILPHRCG